MTALDPAQLAQLLAPLLPYLLKGGAELAKGALGEGGKRLTAAAWEDLKGLAEQIRQRAQGKPALQEVLADAQANPQDEDAVAALCLQLRKLLQDDPALAAEAARQLAGLAAGGNTAIASGDLTVSIGGDASGNIIITGDSNRVEKDSTRRPLSTTTRRWRLSPTTSGHTPIWVMFIASRAAIRRPSRPIARP